MTSVGGSAVVDVAAVVWGDYAGSPAVHCPCRPGSDHTVLKFSLLGSYRVVTVCSLVLPLPQDRARALDNQQALDRESAYCHSFGSREMSELWLPRWHCPFLFWPRGGRKRRVGFWTWDCGWLMAINSISHLSSLPHYWVVAGLSWWVLPCCCEAGLLEEGAYDTATGPRRAGLFHRLSLALAGLPVATPRAARRARPLVGHAPRTKAGIATANW